MLLCHYSYLLHTFSKWSLNYILNIYLSIIVHSINQKFFCLDIRFYSFCVQHVSIGSLMQLLKNNSRHWFWAISLAKLRHKLILWTLYICVHFYIIFKIGVCLFGCVQTLQNVRSLLFFSYVVTKPVLSWCAHLSFCKTWGNGAKFIEN